MKKIQLLWIFICCYAAQLSAQGSNNADMGQHERSYYISTMLRIADPVLHALAKKQLRATMPVEATDPKRDQCTHLEAIGRLLSGMAPWLELGPDISAEGQLRKKYIDLSVVCIRNAVDPASPDFMNFNKGRQPLVDAAFLAQALLRAPKQLWGGLDKNTQANVLAALRSSRVITPNYSNWLLFSAMVEAALQQFDQSGDMMRIDYALKSHESWYKGDGVYGDGPEFHFDYYNSFVIQPMLLEVFTVVMDTSKATDKMKYRELVRRSQRYAAIQERMISPEGSFPPVGRSLAYRFGAFQLLSKMAYMHALPQELKPQQVRAALYAVIKRQIEIPGTFDKNGWLQIGFAGHQPGIGESYISTGSLYLCSQAFIVLGLPANDAFWTGEDLAWTAKKIWSGQDVPVDQAIRN